MPGTPSLLAGFGVKRGWFLRKEFGEFRVTWRLATLIGLVALLCPALAEAQTNLDQGKSASQIFANACVECHKEPHGLAKGRSASALADFLREHYTTNSQQAAALAAYVMGGRSADTAPATQGRGAKPAPEHASVEEPKSNRQGRLSAKPEERSRRTPSGQAARPAEQENSDEQPTIMRPVLTPATTAHNRHKEPKTAPPTATTTEPDAGTHTPAAAAVEPPSASEPPPRERSAPSPAAAAAAPAEPTPAAAAAPAEAGENAPVPRDHIPD
jgi:hypothetical protein